MKNQPPREEQNDRIKEALDQRAHWICFKNEWKDNELTVISKNFVNEIDNVSEWDTIFDLKAYAEEYGVKKNDE